MGAGAGLEDGVCSKQVLALTQTWAPQLLSSAMR